MDAIDRVVEWLSGFVWGGFRIGEEEVPIAVLMLLGTGIFLTLRLGFVQIRRIGHGFAVTSGKYDDPNEPGDVSHFQALSTALSATVGIGNIAGVAIALHWGGPGALFWMWVTAFLGMATKFTEVTLAQQYRSVETDENVAKWEGTVAGGPMYYIERGLGPKWKPLAVLFATLLGITAFFTGNAIQANTLADTVRNTFGPELVSLGVPATVNLFGLPVAGPVLVTGILSAMIVGLVIIGGIRRIGRVTGVLAPTMAAFYVVGAMIVILLNVGQLPAAFALVFREAFNPTAGVAGTGIGALLVTMMWGVRRGLFSNEAGQGSAPIAHAAAKTDEPVSEGVVALLEPFIDTIVICTMTGLVIIMTNTWDDKHPTALSLSGGDISYVADLPGGEIDRSAPRPAEIIIDDGLPVVEAGGSRFAWHDVRVDRFFTDPVQTQPFTGTIFPAEFRADDAQGQEYRTLYGDAVETAAPLTQLAFERGLPGRIGRFSIGSLIVFFGVLLFAISTAISWSYYGDRCAKYLFGTAAVMPYRIVFVVMHFVGAVAPLASIWALGDVFLGVVIFPNLIALLLLNGKVKELKDSYFRRRPWLENAGARARAIEEQRRESLVR